MLYDYIVITGYFCLILGIGFVFKNMASKSTSDYFRGGGKMLWWMVYCLYDAILRLDLHRRSGQSFHGWLCCLFGFLCEHFFIFLRLGLFLTPFPADAGRHANGRDTAPFWTPERVVFLLRLNCLHPNKRGYLAQRIGRIF